MTATNDIFGNLDDFLENYDDNWLETSKLSEVAIGGDHSLAEDGQSSSIIHKLPTMSRNNRNKENKNNNKTSPEQVASAPGSQTTELASVNSVPQMAPASIPTIIDVTESSSIQDEMQQLTNMYDFVFNNKDPTVNTCIKSHHLFTSTKRSFSTLNNSFLKRVPSQQSEIVKFQKRIETVHKNLAQLNTFVESLLQEKTLSNAPADASERRAAPARRRSRRLANVLPNAAQVITIDSDEDIPRPQTNYNANNSFESENYEMRIKIKWANRIEIFTHRKHQKFCDLIAKLAVKEAADTKCILLNLDDRIIYADDTPDTINYKTFQFISGRVLKDQAPIMQKIGPSSAVNDNMISLKVQLAARRAPICLQMNRNQTMIMLVIKCAEELKCDPESIKLYFDGELVDNSSKPEDLELEGDEVLDMRLAHE